MGEVSHRGRRGRFHLLWGGGRGGGVRGLSGPTSSPGLSVGLEAFLESRELTLGRLRGAGRSYLKLNYQLKVVAEIRAK